MGIINKLKDIFPRFYHHGCYEITPEIFIPSKYNKLTAFEINASNCKEMKLSKNTVKMLIEQPDHFGGFGFRDADGNYVGYLFYMKRGGREILYNIKHVDICLVALRVFDEYRGNSYSGEIMSYVIQYLFDNGAKTLYSMIKKQNKLSIMINEKLGFRKIGDKRFIKMGNLIIPYHSL